MEADLTAAIAAGALVLRSALRTAEALIEEELRARVARRKERRAVRERIATFQARAACAPDPRWRRHFLEHARQLETDLLHPSAQPTATVSEIGQTLQLLEQQRQALGSATALALPSDYSIGHRGISA